MWQRMGGTSSTFVGNPRKGKKRNSGFGFSTRNPVGPVIAGIPVVEAGLGALAAISVGAAVESIGVVQDQIAKLPAAAQPAAGPVLTGVAAWAGYQYGSGMIKEISKWALIASFFRLVDNVASKQIKTAVTNLFPPSLPAPGAPLPPTKGIRGQYLDLQRMSGTRPAMAGMYMNTQTGGAYAAVPGLVQTAGQRSMFGIR